MLTIGKLAKRARVSTDSIRFYERLGLLDATTRTTSGYRLYAEGAVRQVAFIKHAQRCGFSLPEIRELLHSGSAAQATSAHALALRKKSEIEQTIGALRTMHAALSQYLSSGAQTVLLAAAALATDNPLIDSSIKLPF